ncbi:hypothetical protein [Moorena sp. SIO3I6]|uniref:hypothetical protein n=1 Tax=Moorena sp. SIO3I6 TaxID=2607831 RepID=UPI0025CDCBFB|nr:hypothetical protein [Moorena sp. SIO3I6]
MIAVASYQVSRLKVSRLLVSRCCRLLLRTLAKRPRYGNKLPYTERHRRTTC